MMHDTLKRNDRSRVSALIPLIVLLLMSVPMIFADEPTDLDFYWEGDNAAVIYTITSDENVWTQFSSSGDYITGELHIIDYNDDPGGLGFDTLETTVSAYFSGGGEIKFENMVIDTLASSYTKIESNNGSGYLGWKTTINSTHLLSFNSENLETDYEIQADGIFEVMHEVFNPQSEGIKLTGDGVGSIFIDLDKEWVSATAFMSGIEEGDGVVLGYYSGEFKVEFEADNYLLGDWVFELFGETPPESVNGDFSFVGDGGYTKLTLENDYGFILSDFGSEGD